MKKYLFFLISCLLVISMNAQDDIFFSEYVEGSGNNKALEIYNPTDQAIDLSEYYVLRFSNGSSVFTEGGATQLQGTIQPYSTFVLVNGQTTSTSSSPACSPELQALADQLDGDYPAPTYMNGNDAIALVKTTDGEAPNDDMTNVISVDLFGQIGLGNSISSETGWSYVQDSTLTYNNSAGEPVTGQVVNYIVQAYATDGSTYGPYWMAWTKDHSLIRKPTVVTGVKINPDPFVVTLEWDTVPGVIDSSGYITYKDIWTDLGSHKCIADPNYQSVNENKAMGQVSIYPNPVTSGYFSFESTEPVKAIAIYDITGREVKSCSFENSLKQNLINTGVEVSGIYIVKAIFIDNSYISNRILIK